MPTRRGTKTLVWRLGPGIRPSTDPIGPIGAYYEHAARSVPPHSNPNPLPLCVSVGNPWPTSYVFGGLTPTLAVLFRKGNATELADADAFYFDSLPTWINSSFRAPLSSKVDCTKLDASGYPPLGCWGSGCPLEHTYLSRAFAMHSSSSPYVLSGQVAGFTNRTEAALSEYFFR